MKPTLLLYLLCTAMALTAQPYQYKPFLKNTNWGVQFADIGSSHMYWYENAFTVKIGVYDYAAITYCGTGDVLFYIRENIPGKKVYYMRADDMQEHVLYDFSLTVGSTFEVVKQMIYDMSTEHKLTRIDTTYINNQPHRVFTFTETEGMMKLTVKFTEGIGCTQEPFLIRSLHSDPEYFLRCVFQGKLRMYGQDTCDNPCYIPTQIEEVDSQDIVIFPNPAGTYIELKGLDAGTYEIFNSTGQSLMKGDCTSRIEISNLSTGYYTLVVQTGTKILVRQLAKE